MRKRWPVALVASSVTGVVGVSVVAPDADDAGAGRQVAGHVAREHGRQQLAHRKVATAAKEYEVEIGNRHDGSDLRQ